MSIELELLGHSDNIQIGLLKAEIERLRAIVRVNGLRWGHSHAEIDQLLNQQQTKEEK